MLPARLELPILSIQVPQLSAFPPNTNLNTVSQSVTLYSVSQHCDLPGVGVHSDLVVETILRHVLVYLPPSISLSELETIEVNCQSLIDNLLARNNNQKSSLLGPDYVLTCRGCSTSVVYSASSVG